MSNMDSANDFLMKAKKAAERRDFESAKAYTDMAQVAMIAHHSDKVAKVAEKIDRVASILNNGKSWH